MLVLRLTVLEFESRAEQRYKSSSDFKWYGVVAGAKYKLADKVYAAVV